jgi:hypothetical protein
VPADRRRGARSLQSRAQREREREAESFARLSRPWPEVIRKPRAGCHSAPSASVARRILAQIRRELGSASIGKSRRRLHQRRPGDRRHTLSRHDLQTTGKNCELRKRVACPVRVRQIPERACRQRHSHYRSIGDSWLQHMASRNGSGSLVAPSPQPEPRIRHRRV